MNLDNSTYQRVNLMTYAHEPALLGNKRSSTDVLAPVFRAAFYEGSGIERQCFCLLRAPALLCRPSVDSESFERLGNS